MLSRKEQIVELNVKQKLSGFKVYLYGFYTSSTPRRICKLIPISCSSIILQNNLNSTSAEKNNSTIIYCKHTHYRSFEISSAGKPFIYDSDIDLLHSLPGFSITTVVANGSGH